MIQISCENICVYVCSLLKLRVIIVAVLTYIYVHTCMYAQETKITEQWHVYLGETVMLRESQ